MKATMILVCLGVLGLATPVSGQTVTDQRVWTAIAAQGRLGARSPWRWSSDFMIRTRDGSRTMDFLSGRIAISRDLTRRSSAGTGYAYGEGFPDGRDTLWEHRFFQQYAWSVGTARRLTSLRTRLEERVLEGNDALLFRLRQQARVTWSLSASGRRQLVFSEEAFVHVNTTARASRGFDHNRVFAGVRHALTTRSSVEIGYLNVYARSASGATRHSHILATTMTVAY